MIVSVDKDKEELTNQWLLLMTKIISFKEKKFSDGKDNMF